MSDGIQVILRKATALGVSAMMVVTLSAIAVIKADHSKGKQVVSGNAAGSSGSFSAGTEQGQGSAQAQAGQAAGAAAGAAASGPAAAAAQTGGAAKKAQGAAAAAGGQCPDYKPDIGVFHDHLLVRGSTV